MIFFTQMDKELKRLACFDTILSKYQCKFLNCQNFRDMANIVISTYCCTNELRDYDVEQIISYIVSAEFRLLQEAFPAEYFDANNEHITEDEYNEYGGERELNTKVEHPIIDYVYSILIQIDRNEYLSEYIKDFNDRLQSNFDMYNSIIAEIPYCRS